VAGYAPPEPLVLAGRHTIFGMSPTEDDPLRAIRVSRAYRAAIWLARLANLVLLPVVFWGIASVAEIAPPLPDSVFILAWAVGAATLLSAMVLFYRSSLPLESMGLSWPIDRRLRYMVLRDVFGIVRRGRAFSADG
jgi:hypothetical protein